MGLWLVVVLVFLLVSGCFCCFCFRRNGGSIVFRLSTFLISHLVALVKSLIIGHFFGSC